MSDFDVDTECAKGYGLAPSMSKKRFVCYLCTASKLNTKNRPVYLPGVDGLRNHLSGDSHAKALKAHHV